MIESKEESRYTQKTLLDFYEKNIAKISIDAIFIQDRIRSKSSELQIGRLADSIKQIGLLNPITITKNNRLVAGYHRLFACKKLGWEKIPCIITTIDEPLLLKLQEIDENLIRYELHFIERGQHLKERKEVFKELGLIFDRGGDRKSDDFKLHQMQFENKNAFIEDTEKKTGLNERTIHQDLQIVENIEPEIQDFIRDKEISKRDALKISRMPKEDQLKIKEEIEKGNTKDNFIEKTYAKVKKQKKPKNVPKLPEDKFNIIYADPPWKYDHGADETRIIENQYPTMETMDICSMAIPSAKDSILFLWVPSPKLEDGLEVIKEWGFVYKTNMVWVKDKIGMGYYARGQHELLLIATKGTPGTPDPSNRPSSVIEAPRTKHSKKPDIVYNLIEQMYPNGKYLELFARNKRDKWISWGDEIEN